MAPAEKKSYLQKRTPRNSSEVARDQKISPKQSYEEICRTHDKTNLFEDPEFPADGNSIGAPGSRNVVWKRPHEICDNPSLFVDDASRFDIVQGELGDCWLMAAVANLTMYPQLLQRVVPPDQNDFNSPGYCGAFKFAFWRFGGWVEVVVDDRLVVSSNDKLKFMHSADNNEFWSALLEKAYAKLLGNYENLKGGETSEAMTDFTGGFCESHNLREKTPPNLWNIVKKAFERKSLIGVSMTAVEGEVEAKVANGLIAGHAYSVTKANEIQVKGETVQLIRVRNPWGNSAEWTGDYADESKAWEEVDKGQRAELGVNFEHDGEFWMSFPDFTKNFQKLEICNLSPDAVTEELAEGEGKRWDQSLIDGAWKRGVNAGGCLNYKQTFWNNPQFRVKVEDPDDDEDDLCTILVGLMQKDRRKQRHEGLTMLHIGFAIYKIEDRSGLLDDTFFKKNRPKAMSPPYLNCREQCARFSLSPGSYVVVPTTFEPHQPGDFLVRIYTEKAAVAEELDEEESTLGEPKVVAKDPSPAEKKMELALEKLFTVLAGEDMEIDAYELQQLLNTTFMKEFKFDGFCLDTCRSMVALHDEDYSGKLGFEEFQELWREMRIWKLSFKTFDEDNSGFMSSYELRAALSAAGFRLKNDVFACLAKRYSNEEGQIEFDEFIHCAIRLKCMFSTFRKFQENPKIPTAKIGVDEFIVTAMYS